MKIQLNQDPGFQDVEIIINCPRTDEEILRIVAMLRIYDQKLTGIKDGEIRLLDVKEIFYIDTADKKTFLYTQTEIYESALRLYELEERLEGMDFIRAGKSSIVNFCKIQSIRPELGGRMLLTMENGEQLYVSRQYAAQLKEKLNALERRRGR